MQLNCAKQESRPNMSRNNSLKELLLNTGTKTIVECSKDRDWGTGVPLGRFDCLSEDKWLWTRYSRPTLDGNQK